MNRTCTSGRNVAACVANSRPLPPGGSTTLSARMDPEDFGEIVSAYHKSISETVHRLGGFVANYMGDGVLVYFGYPQAHEDDAERAVMQR
jgi:class 3 adenylate cyclase